MDDPKVYGESVEFFSFKSAIYSIPPILTDYKVIGLYITRTEINHYIKNNVLLRVKGVKWTEEIEASMFASLIALNKAHQHW